MAPPHDPDSDSDISTIMPILGPSRRLDSGPDSDYDSDPPQKSQPKRTNPSKPKAQRMPKQKEKRLPPFEVILSTALAQGRANTGVGFFDLSPEVRKMIYSQFDRSKYWYFGDGVDRWQRVSQYNMLDFNPLRKQNWRSHSYQIESLVRYTDRPLLALIGTCRKIYAKALPVLYGEMIFRYDNISHLNSLLERVGPNGRACIQYIKQWNVVENSTKRTYKLKPIASGFENLKRLTIFLTQSQYAFEKTGDDMHPICTLREVALEVLPCDDLEHVHPCWPRTSKWYKEHKDECEAFAAKMVAHVAQPRGT